MEWCEKGEEEEAKSDNRQPDGANLESSRQRDLSPTDADEETKELSPPVRKVCGSSTRFLLNASRWARLIHT